MGLVGWGWEEVGVAGGKGFGLRGRDREEGWCWEEEEVLVALSAIVEACCWGSAENAMTTFTNTIIGYLLPTCCNEALSYKTLGTIA